MQWTSANEIFDLYKMWFFYEFLKPENAIFLRSTHAADHKIHILSSIFNKLSS